MNVSNISLSEYINLIGESCIDSIFQLPQYHALREIVHTGEQRFEPLKIEAGEKILLVPLIVSESTKGFPEYQVPFNSIFPSQGNIEPEDYHQIFQILKTRFPLKIKISSSLKNPDLSNLQKQFHRVKISRQETYVLRLPGNYDDWFNSLDPQVRREIKKAEKLGIQIKKKRKDGLDNFIFLFYREFFDMPEMLNTWPEIFYRSLFDTMPTDSVYIYEACYEGKTVASSLVIMKGSECFYHSSSYDTQYRQIYANHLIQSFIIRDLIAYGYETYNMGGTNEMVSLAQFKAKFGATPVIYQTAVWKNRWNRLLKFLREKMSLKFKIKKHFFLEKNLVGDEESPKLSVPPGMELYYLQSTEELDKLINEGYELRGLDHRGKRFMKEELARTRLEQKQMVILVFRNKLLVHSRCVATPESVNLIKLMPPISLPPHTAFSWHVNTPPFFRKLGYNNLFTLLEHDILKNKGFNKIYSAVLAGNIPALKTHEKAGFSIKGSFYLLGWKKRKYCLGVPKL